MITSVGAVEVYDLEPDTVPKFSLMASGYEVAVASTEAQMDELLADLGLGVANPSLYSLAYWLNQIRANTREIANAFISSTGVFFSDGYYLDSDGDRFYGSGYTSFSDLLRVGLLGLSENLKSLSSSFDLSSLVSAVNTNTTAVNAVTTAVNSNKSAVDLVRVAVNNTTAAVEDTTSAVEDTTAAVNGTTAAVNALAPFFSVPSGLSVLVQSGPFTTTSATSISHLLRNGFLGLYQPLQVQSGVNILTSSGVFSTTSSTSISHLLRNGLLGLNSGIHGSKSNFSYSGSLIDNQNQTSSFSVSGLGPMLQRYLEEIQHDSGLLTYIFASPEDLEMKENSSSSMSAINDSFIDPDSDTSVSVSDIGTLSSAAGSIESFGSTGVTPDQAFAQLGNDSIFAFFSQTTADNLDSRPSSYSLRDPSSQIVTSYYSDSRAEFFNLIGEGSE